MLCANIVVVALHTSIWYRLNIYKLITEGIAKLINLCSCAGPNEWVPTCTYVYNITLIYHHAYAHNTNIQLYFL